MLNADELEVMETWINDSIVPDCASAIELVL